MIKQNNDENENPKEIADSDAEVLNELRKVSPWAVTSQSINAMLGLIVSNEVTLQDSNSLAELLNRSDPIEMYNATTMLISFIINIKNNSDGIKKAIFNLIRTKEEAISDEEIFNIILKYMAGV